MTDKATTLISTIFAVLFLSSIAAAQTSAFTYQGRLTDAGSPATGNFLMQFKLFDAAAAGSQIGSTITDVPITASQGIFSTRLDFGAGVLNGANRWLEIAVRHNAGEAYSTLSPREQIASSPYAVRTLSAAMADDSQKLGGVDASQYVTTATVGNSFIRNQTLQQTNANFNISGNGTLGGSLTINGASANLTAAIAGGIASIGTTTNSRLSLFTNGGTNNGSLTLDTSGNIGINTIFPNHKLTIDTLGGPTWTTDGWGGAIALRNSSAIGWQLNSAGQSFGIGQSTGGLSFFHTNSGPGTTGNPPIYEMVIANTGAVGIGTTVPNAKLFVQGEFNGVGIAATGNASQSRDKGGWVKAMIQVNPDGTIARCYNGQTGVSTGNCGFSVTLANPFYRVNFGFQVSDRFFSLTATGDTAADSGRVYPSTSNASVCDVFYFDLGSSTFPPTGFYLIVY